VEVLALVLSAVLTAQVQESITVTRVLVDVRVTDYDGAPVEGLTAADFDVRIGGRKATVESVEWVDDVGGWRSAVDGSSPAPEPVPREPPTANRQPGRLFVVFVQTDFARESLRTAGQMKFLQFARRMIADLPPEDRVAVFSFDSHLKFRLDFSNDRAAIDAALEDTLWIDHPPPPPAGEPSLSAQLNRDAMKRAAHSETGLFLVAQALRSIPGPKSLLLLGWGLGERTLAGVQMKRQWAPARAALDAARVSIFALDTTYADYHDLEVGLQSAAEQTGGFYAKTHLFPLVAIEKLQRTLSGHYELELRPHANLKPGSHAIDVRVARRGTYVLAPSSVTIRR
jgi:VWFA-related protein